MVRICVVDICAVVAGRCVVCMAVVGMRVTVDCCVVWRCVVALLRVVAAVRRMHTQAGQLFTIASTEM